MKIYTANKETGMFIEECGTILEALEKIKEYEAADEREGTFEPDFYDIVDEEHGTITSFIKAERIKCGLTIKQVSEMTGVPYRTLQNWEAGVRRCPDYVERLVLEKIKAE